jgi:hypothetical protein
MNPGRTTRCEDAAAAADRRGGSAVVVASPSTVLALQSTKLAGVLGVLALYWSRGSHASWFVGGLTLLVASVVTFRWLRARLIARTEHVWMLRGARAGRARTWATRDVDRLLRISPSRAPD